MACSQLQVVGLTEEQCDQVVNGTHLIEARWSGLCTRTVRVAGLGALPCSSDSTETV